MVIHLALPSFPASPITFVSLHQALSSSASSPPFCEIAIFPLLHPNFPPSILLSQLSRPHTPLPPKNIMTWRVLHCGVSTVLRGDFCSCVALWFPAVGHRALRGAGRSTGVRGEAFSPACRGWEGSNRLSLFLRLLQQKVIFGGIHVTSLIFVGSPCT